MSKFKYITVDCETSGLDWTKDLLHGIGIGYAEDEAEYYPIWAIPDNIKRDLANPKISKVGHNLHSFDAKFIRKAGIDIAGEFDDTMILANLVDDTIPLDLKYLADKFIGVESLDNKRRLDQYISEVGAGNIAGLCARDLADPEHPHTKIIAEYCKEDVNNTTKLFWLFVNKLKEMDTILKGPAFGFKKSPLDYYVEEARPLERVLFEIEYRGIRVNLDYIETIRNNAVSRMNEIETILNKVFVNRIPKVEDEIYAKAVSKVVTDKAKAKIIKGQGKCKFSWGNNNNVGDLLARHCDLDSKLVAKTDKGKVKTDKGALELLRTKLPSKSPLVRCLTLFSEYKLLAKIAQTYTGDADKGIMSRVRYVDGVARIFPVYRQTTGTGRLACKNPNMQNLKRDSEVKKFFIPDNPDEVFDDADYSQIELRTGAHLSQDPGLIRAYVCGEDVHLKTAGVLFGRDITKADDVERQAGKRTNFLTIFDGGPNRLQTCLKQDTGKDFTKVECKRFIKLWFEAYPQVRGYLDSQLEFFKKYKFCISETGRVRRLPDIVFGKDLRWVKSVTPSYNGGVNWIPNYYGSQANRELLISRIIKKNKKLTKDRVSESMIGWEANRRYTHAIKAGYNQPIQGLAASMTKRSMVKLHNLGRVIANQVHDNLSVPRKRGDLEARKQLVNVMETIYPLSVPVLADVKTLNSFHPKDKSND